MKFEIIESINLSLNKDEKDVLSSIVKTIKKISKIDLDSNNALEEIDEIKKDENLSKFISIFSDID